LGKKRPRTAPLSGPRTARGALPVFTANEDGIGKLHLLNNAGQIKAPMLVVQGRDGPRVPVTESEQTVEQFLLKQDRLQLAGRSGPSALRTMSRSRVNHSA
jgi:hypothetical protein